MPGTIDTPGPSYISSHSADVILSEVRPIKLKVDALHCINVLLDEFLYNILSASCSLSTDRLRASLLSLLPTTLGKEALLEAEVELRAYWERTGPANATVVSLEDRTFHLQWIYKLLRLKCEAYSTLNESDEDPGAEEHITMMMVSAGCSPPKPTLISPAALYLTAILEALCEHILSNVGRVAARDSSRNNATIHDLFTALCEDHSIYNLFRSMKVYEEIEQLSKAPKLRRSKSLTPSDRAHAASPHPELPIKDASSARSRLSSEGDGMTTAPPVANPRSSIEKTKAIKMFMNNSRSSVDRDGESQNGHKRSDSTLSDHSKRNGTPPLNDEPVNMSFESDMQQEFDDLMRSSATMKVSLTPDRLKTMEVYKQERDQRGNRRLAPLSFQTNSDPSSVPSRGTGRRPSLLRVDSIKEDEEENISKPQSALPQTRSRQASLSSFQGAPFIGGRLRSMSAAPRVLVKEQLPPPLPPTPSKIMQGNRRAQGHETPNPIRTRRVQRNRESMDLDDVMGGSDEDGSLPTTPKTPKSVITTPRRAGKGTVSSGTRELMDFLAEGPPSLGPSTTDLASEVSTENGKQSRLQRMISKLSLSNSERSKTSMDDLSKSKFMPSPPRQTLSNQPSLTNVYLANRPVPPRLPRADSPNTAPSREGSQDMNHRPSRVRSASLIQPKQKSLETSATEPPPLPRDHADNLPPALRQEASRVDGRDSLSRNGRIEASVPTTPLRTHNTITQTELPSPPSISPYSPPQPPPVQSRKPASEPTKNITESHISGTDAKDLRRLLSDATTADECRLIFDMFLVKSGLTLEHAPPKVEPHWAVTAPTDAVEDSLVELFLGGGNMEYSNVPPEPISEETLNPKPELESGQQYAKKPTTNGTHAPNGDLGKHNSSDPPLEHYTPSSKVAV